MNGLIQKKLEELKQFADIGDNYDKNCLLCGHDHFDGGEEPDKLWSAVAQSMEEVYEQGRKDGADQASEDC